METLLIVDDDLSLLESLKMHFEDIEHDGGPRYQVVTATRASEALRVAQEVMPGVVILDMKLPDRTGLDIIEEMKSLCGDARIILVTAFHDMETTIRAMKAGAFDYIHKPFPDLTALDIVVSRALEYRQLSRRAATMNVETAAARLGDIVGTSPSMQQLVKEIGKVAASRATVLIHGESGTGKELIARVIHNYSYDEPKPFIGINCSAIVDTLLESELFGHVKGSFTGATTPRRGLFLEADGGTLFLDEIGDMAPELQAKLLRVLEDGEVRAVGADASRKVDVRMVAATHQELEARVREGRFRQDLFYRLNVVPLHVPPLRERREDIPLLVEHFVAQSRKRNPRARLAGFSPEALAALAAAPWPGNVRELENLVERLAVVTVQETVDLPTLQLHAPGVTVEAHPLSRAQGQLIPLRQLEGEYIAYVVAQCGGNKTKAAEILGIDVSTIHRRERERSGNSA